VEHLKGASFRYALAFDENIRLGWKGLPKTNTLAYYGNPKITTVKSLYSLGPLVNCKIIPRVYGILLLFINLSLKTHFL
jgi:hypothetical protein